METKSACREKAGLVRALVSPCRRTPALGRGTSNSYQKSKMPEVKDAKKEIEDYNAKKEMRKTMKYGGQFADCTKTWCCAVGCKCKGENKFYAQCTAAGIDGKRWCHAKGAAKHTEAMLKFGKYKEEEKDTLNKTLQEENKSAGGRGRRGEEEGGKRI